MQKITKDMIIGDILRMDPEMAGGLGGAIGRGGPPESRDRSRMAAFA